MKEYRTSYPYSMNAVYSAVGVSKQSVYQYIARRDLFEARVAELQVEVEAIRREHGGCGLEKMYNMLSPSWIGRDRFISIFQELGYGVKRKRAGHRTTYSGRENIHPNLIKGMQLWKRDQLWQTDITYFWLDGEYNYLTFIIDVYSRRIVGHYVSNHMRKEANIKALKRAISVREGADLTSLVHHSDRGAQYTSNDYQDLLRRHGIKISMCDKAQDNAYGERINGTIKNEYLKHWKIKNYEGLVRATNKAVAHYNSSRMHNNLLHRMSPKAFEDWLSSNTQQRPMVNIYTEGQEKLKGASSPNKLYPTKDLQDHICPMAMNEN